MQRSFYINCISRTPLLSALYFKISGRTQKWNAWFSTQKRCLRSSSVIKTDKPCNYVYGLLFFLHVLLNCTINLEPFYDENFLEGILEVIPQICCTAMGREVTTGLGRTQRLTQRHLPPSFSSCILQDVEMTTA